MYIYTVYINTVEHNLKLTFNRTTRTQAKKNKTKKN